MTGGRSTQRVLRVLVGLLDLLDVVGGADDRDLLLEGVGQDLDRLVGQRLRERRHLAQLHQLLDDLGGAEAERLRDLLDGGAGVDLGRQLLLDLLGLREVGLDPRRAAAAAAAAARRLLLLRRRRPGGRRAAWESMMTRRRPLEPLRPGAARCGRCGGVASPLAGVPPPAAAVAVGALAVACRWPPCGASGRLGLRGRPRARRGAALRDRGEALAAGGLRRALLLLGLRGRGRAPPPLKARGRRRPRPRWRRPPSRRGRPSARSR